MSRDEIIEGAVMAALMHVKPDYRSPARLNQAAKIIADFVSGGIGLSVNDGRNAPGRTRSTHTPGPWSHVKNEYNRHGIDSGHGSIVSDDDGNTFIATIEDAEEAQANARLIAAAPDLLEAAKLLEKAEHDRQFCDNCKEAEEYAPETCPNCFPAFDDTRIMRRNAIAKAEGSAP